MNTIHSGARYVIKNALAPTFVLIVAAGIVAAVLAVASPDPERVDPNTGTLLTLPVAVEA